MFPSAWVELLVPGTLVGQTLWKPCNSLGWVISHGALIGQALWSPWWVKLLVPEPWLEKRSRALYTLWDELLDLEPWLGKRCRALYKLWDEILVVEPWVGQTLWTPVAAVGWVTSLGSWVGTNALEPWKAWVETNLMMVLWCPTVRWNHCLMGWGGFASGSPGWFWLMCFMRSRIHAWNVALGWIAEERFVSAILRPGGTRKSHTGLAFASLIWGYFSLYFYE